MSLEIEGPDLRGLDHEAGGHRIQRVPPTERRGRVHTSTVTVAVLVPGEARPVVGPEDFRVEWYSGSGAGGQHRNKHQNSCRLTHIPTGLIVKAETRSRQNSYQQAMTTLSQKLLERAEVEAHNMKNTLRSQQVGSGMRGDKRRTYRFQEDTVRDHFTGKSARCADVMRGGFEKLWPA